MSYQLFVEKLKAKIRILREEEKENLALGYGRENYEERVGEIAGLDKAVLLAEQVLREMSGAEEQ